MKQNFIRSKNYIVSKKNSYKTTISKIKKQILKVKHNTLSNKKVDRARRNLLKRSYFYRFILRKHTIRSRRTLGLRNEPAFKYREEEIGFYIFSDRARKRLRDRNIRITINPFSFGVIYITHRRRNTFITIFKRYLDKSDRVIFKASVGYAGFKGPKRTTNQGKELVSKMANAFLRYKRINSVDIIFTRRVGRWFTFIIRGLLRRFVFVRHLYIPKRHSHGFTRRKKIRRT